MIDFAPSVLNKLCIGDKIQIRAFGVGLSFNDFEDVTIMNCSPKLLKKLALKVTRGMQRSWAVGSVLQLVIVVTTIFRCLINKRLRSTDLILFALEI